MLSERDKSFIVRVITIVLALLLAFGIFLYFNALWEGRAVFPEQLANAIVFLLVAAVSSASVWLHGRNSKRTRETVEKAERNITHTFENSGGDAIAEKVKAQLEPALREGDRRRPAQPNDTGDRRRWRDQALTNKDMDQLR